MRENIDKIKRQILPILLHYGVKKVGLFGSCVRDDFKRNSDIDILVEIDKNISLLDFIGIKQELEDKLKKKVDLVEYATIKPLLREKILKEQVVIL